MTGKCIICGNPAADLTDEHVIPDSIGGYYHIYSVCKDCNSKLGDNVDTHLVNHWLIQGKRHLLKIPGKSGNIPNPLVGRGILESGEMVTLVEDVNGIVHPRIIPSKPVITKDENGNILNIQLTLDKADEKNVSKILNTICKRNGIDLSKYKITRDVTDHSIAKPVVTSTQTIDIRKFKLAMIKMAYEFAVDKIPGYFDDCMASQIRDMLRNTDFDSIDNVFFGDGIDSDKNLVNFLKGLIDFREDRHVLILANSPIGFVCFIRIFEVFSGAIKLSDRHYHLNKNLDNHNIVMVAINDLPLKSCTFYSMLDIVNCVYMGKRL